MLHTIITIALIFCGVAVLAGGCFLYFIECTQRGKRFFGWLDEALKAEDNHVPTNPTDYRDNLVC